MMKKLGYGDYSRKEFEILKEFLDIDNDGEISMKDMKKCFQFAQNYDNRDTSKNEVEMWKKNI